MFVLIVADSAAAQTVPEVVVVTGKAPDVVHDADRTVYDLKNNLQAQSGSLSDVLATLPSVNVDPIGKVTVRGASAQILVDGKPSAALRGVDLAATLQSMPANSIAKIEVITDPGPKYRTNAAVIINIITKKPDGWEPKGNLTVNTGSNARHNASVSGSFGIDKWVFNGTAGFRQDIRHDISDIDLVSKNADGSTASTLVEHRTTHVPFTYVSGSAEAKYAASDEDVFSIGSEGAIRHRPRQYRDETIITDPTGTTSSVTDDVANQYFNYFAFTANYLHKGPSKGETLTLRMEHTKLNT
ncbi:MAG: TonB-dependent receptor plug domain-containing protein, partial [Candidatus Binatia bacterium]